MFLAIAVDNLADAENLSEIEAENEREKQRTRSLRRSSTMRADGRMAPVRMHTCSRPYTRRNHLNSGRARQSAYGPITIAIRARFEHDSTTIRLQHATTRYEVFRALAYEIVYENQW